MLARLSVKNLAVVEAAEIAFGPGLNVITGETGAGKSVLMGALHLVLGERADRSAIRTGAEEAAVSAVYELSDSSAVDAVLREADVPVCEGGTLILRRSLQANGGGKVRVNDVPATTGLLRRLAPLLTDIHGPTDNLSLLDPSFQLRLLTSYAGADAEFAAYTERFLEVRRLREELYALTGDPEARAAEMDRLSYELEELHAANLSEADGEELTLRHAEAANAEEILTLGNALMERLTDGENALSEQLMALHRVLHDLSKLLPEASDWGNELSGAQMQLQELSRSISVRLSQIDADPEALAGLEERLALVQRLRRRYGPTLDDVLRYRDEAQARLDALNGVGEETHRLTAAIEAAEEALLRAGQALRLKREAAAPRLSAAITEELRDLGFVQAAFPIQMEPCNPGPDGIDRVVFQFEPNPGERPRPLADIASSGEIARIMLAVKSILARHDAIPTLVFDEIDANIGGEISRRVGERLRRLAAYAQILCITHQPQVAVFGQSHFCVRKEIEAGRTVTHIDRLDSVARVAELARMLGGGEAAETHAVALLREQGEETE